MFGKSCRHRSAHSPRHQAWQAMKPSGNRAFDAYKADTLARLEAEQEAFESFLERLRDAKDKAEFDQFMEDRAKRAKDTKDAQVSEQEEA